MKRRLALVSVLVALLLLAVPISTQEVLLRQDGRITATSERLPDGTPVQWHSVASPGDTLIQVHAVSVDFPIELLVEVPGRSREYARAEMGSAMLSLSVSGAGTIRVGVAAATPGEQGGYSLRIEASAPAIPLTLGRPEAGVMPPSGAAGARQVLYRYAGRAGEMVRIQLSSRDFDTFLTVIDDAGQVAENDDAFSDGHESTTDSELMHFFADAGTILIQAGSWGGYGSGRFSVLVSPVSVETTHTPGRRLAEDEVVTGLMTPVDERFDGRRAQRYTIAVTAGQEVDVLMRSPEFDAYLIAVSPGGRRYEDDDSGGGLDAQLVFTAEEPGDWTIYAASFGSQPSGTYTIRYVSRAPRPVAERFSGQLREQGFRHGSRVFQVHTFSTEAGADYRVDLRSFDFDTYLVVLDGTGVPIAENDDFGGSTDSRVEFRSQGGTYSVLAGAFSGTPSGRYEIEIRR